MEYTGWSIRNEEFARRKKRSRDALFTIANGYLGIRGFFEEDAGEVDRLGGIYMAGVFGKGPVPVWEGMSRELCNLANVLKIRLAVDGENVQVTEQSKDFMQETDLKRALYTRSYQYKTKSGKSVRLSFERFVSMEHIHYVGQSVRICPVDGEIRLKADFLMDSEVVNLNWESCEPYPVQPGRDHITGREIEEDFMKLWLDDVDETQLFYAQKCRAVKGERKLEGRKAVEGFATGEVYETVLSPGEELAVEKLACIASSKDREKPEESIRDFQNKSICYQEEKKAHIRKWEEKWQVSDIQIEGKTADQTVLRYNIFQLLGVCPEHTDRLSIGARGLSGEMYEGCVFWDNEIFKLPFFIYTNPRAARKLLTFRYHTLEAAKRHAKKNWFAGAMYPWQASEKGIEQTPYDVGAYYAIHIVADIAYAICQYWQVTADDEFLLSYGMEMLTETARFFVSRSDFNKAENCYEIRAVRGPNEYDVYVNNNAYTNLMAAGNMKAAKEGWDRILQKYPAEAEALYEKLGLSEEELDSFAETARLMKIPRKETENLYLEDEDYLKRRPLNLKKAKPTGKRIIDSTLPYEALPLYQVTKQADVVLLMNLLPELFTEEEKRAAYDFYEPRTAHDSSLSYAPYGMMAARLGKEQEAYEYFVKSAYLDIEDRQLNTVSGLHFANFGGTWQMVYFGYAGIRKEENRIRIEPCLPELWSMLETAVLCKEGLLRVQIRKEQITVRAERLLSEVQLLIEGEAYRLSPGQKQITVRRTGDEAESVSV